MLIASRPRRVYPDPTGPVTITLTFFFFKQVWQREPAANLYLPPMGGQVPSQAPPLPPIQTPIIDFHNMPNNPNNHSQNSIIQNGIDPLETCPPQSSCCTVDPDMNPPCSCDAIEVPNTNSERSSSYNSCTLPLKPLKGILKKSSNAGTF